MLQIVEMRGLHRRLATRLLLGLLVVLASTIQPAPVTVTHGQEEPVPQPPSEEPIDPPPAPDRLIAVQLANVQNPALTVACPVKVMLVMDQSAKR